MSTRTARGGQLAAQLAAAGHSATTDPQVLGANLPAVLVLPPVLAFDSYVGPTCTWRLLLVASTPEPWRAWQQLDPLVSAVAELLPVERAEPATFAPDPAADPLPAYALTFTETLED